MERSWTRLFVVCGLALAACGGKDELGDTPGADSTAPEARAGTDVRSLGEAVTPDTPAPTDFSVGESTVSDGACETECSDGGDVPLGTLWLTLDPLLGKVDECIMDADPTDAEPPPSSAQALKHTKWLFMQVWTHAPISSEDPPLFDSLVVQGCLPLMGTSIKVQDLQAGDNLFVLVQGFSDSGCSDATFFGSRAGIVLEAGEMEAPAGLYACSTLNW